MGELLSLGWSDTVYATVEITARDILKLSAHREARHVLRHALAINAVTNVSFSRPQYLPDRNQYGILAWGAP